MAGLLDAWLADADACCVVVRRTSRVSCPAAFESIVAPKATEDGDEEPASTPRRQAPPAPLLTPLSPSSSSRTRSRRESYHGDGPLSCGTGAALAAASDARERASFLLRTLD